MPPAAASLVQDPNHRLSIPLIEAALALMRLSTEKFFVLLSLYVAFLLFKTPPPAVARLIGLNARISNAFARLVLYSFPCVCWVYGAGITFSTLVSCKCCCTRGQHVLGPSQVAGPPRMNG
jgi:hypothetical protein